MERTENNVLENPMTMDSILNRDQRTTKTIEGKRSTPLSTASRGHERLVYENCDKCTNSNKVNHKKFSNFREYNKPNTFKSDIVRRFHTDPFPFFSEKKLKWTEKRINLRNVFSRK